MILERHEVCDIHPYDMLAPKMHPKFVAAKLFPKSLLCNLRAPFLPLYHSKHPSLWEGLGGLSVFVHLFVIFLIVARCDVVEPFLVVKIPADCFLDALLKLQ